MFFFNLHLKTTSITVNYNVLLFFFYFLENIFYFSIILFFVLCFFLHFYFISLFLLFIKLLFEHVPIFRIAQLLRTVFLMNHIICTILYDSSIFYYQIIFIFLFSFYWNFEFIDIFPNFHDFNFSLLIF